MFISKLPPAYKQLVIVSIANLTFLHIGLGVGWISPVMVILSKENQTVLPEPLTQVEMSWIMSISSIVDLFAFIFTGYLADSIGRKYCLLLSCIPKIATCFLLVFATHAWMLLLARAINGLSEAFTISVSSCYVSEIASKEIRGGLGSVFQIWWTVGSMIMLSVGPFISFKAINIIYTTVVLVTCVPLLFLPESPYFLYSKGRTDETIKLLTSLRGSETLARQEIEEYSKSKQKLSIQKHLKDRTVQKTLVIAVFIALCSQLSGNTFIAFNLQMIFEKTNTSVSSAISSAIIGFITVLASCGTIYFSDRFGRKPVLVTALSAQAVGLIGLGTFFKLTQESNEITGFLNYLPLVSVVLAMYSHCAGMGSLMWILIAELFDGPTRAFGMSLGVFVTCLSGFLTLRYTNSIMTAMGLASTYWMFAGIAITASLFILLFIPETKGKTFLDIQDGLRGKKAKKKGEILYN